MLERYKSKRDEGFTIIEVLIVLAIAGLIILIVFLAVPALQRNARNNQRQSDAARVASAVNDWVTNNNGATFVAGSANANLNVVRDAVQPLGQYTLNPGTSFTVATGAQSAINNVANIRVVTNAQCGENGVTVSAGGNQRQMAVQFAAESGGATPTGRCVNV